MTVPGKPLGVPDIDPPNSISYGSVLQWFDYWLNERAAAGLPPARVVSYQDTSTKASGRWCGFDQWPAA
jgi:hypothetical protein